MVNILHCPLEGRSALQCALHSLANFRTSVLLNIYYKVLNYQVTSIEGLNQGALPAQLANSCSARKSYCSVQQLFSQSLKLQEVGFLQTRGLPRGQQTVLSTLLPELSYLGVGRYGRQEFSVPMATVCGGQVCSGTKGPGATEDPQCWWTAFTSFLYLLRPKRPCLAQNEGSTRVKNL